MSPFLTPPLSHALRFSARAVQQVQSVNYLEGDAIRLHIVLRVHDGQGFLIVNDQPEGAWGEELRLPLDLTGEPVIGAAFTPEGMVITPRDGEPFAFRPGLPLPPRLLLRAGPDIAVTDAPLPAAALAVAPTPPPAAPPDDTLAGLPPHVGLLLRWALPTGAGLLLHGQLRDPMGAVAVPEAWHLLPPSDDTGRRGFLALLPAAPAITLHSGETAALPLPDPRPPSLAALRAALDAAGPLPEPGAVFDRVLGPSLLALHRAIRAEPLTLDRHDSGPLPEAPRASVIIPLHGRLDMLTAQMALLSGLTQDEVILVLDDPPRRAAAVALVDSLWQRFGVPARLILPSTRQGFGAASNLGLAAARGRVVCFLNSDAFPQGHDWLDHLVRAAEAPGAGVVGARLLYPDGSLQHGGMVLVPSAAQGGWRFPEHPGKGLRPPPPAEAPREVEAVTGACMAVARGVAERLGGFDPDYVIGDFEDADLCLRARQAGLLCVMEDRAMLVHLERQSQGEPSAGRWNLTLLNAWTFNRRWPNAAPLVAAPRDA